MDILALCFYCYINTILASGLFLAVNSSFYCNHFSIAWVCSYPYHGSQPSQLFCCLCRVQSQSLLSLRYPTVSLGTVGLGFLSFGLLILSEFPLWFLILDPSHLIWILLLRVSSQHWGHSTGPVCHRICHFSVPEKKLVTWGLYRPFSTSNAVLRLASLSVQWSPTGEQISLF